MKRVFLSLAVLFATLAVRAADVVVVAHEKGYYTSLANHVSRWLSGCGIPSAAATPNDMATALATARIAFLVGFNEPGAAEMRTLRDYRRRGGKLVVFYSASPALASLMDVKPLGYKAADYPGKWSRMAFCSKVPDGLPSSILQTSTVLQRAVPVKGRGRVLATWLDRNGRQTGDAAWIATSGGFWMTHVLLADGDEDLKAQLLASMVGSVLPKRWNAQAFLAKRRAEREATAAFAKRQHSRKGEIHAVWDHSGCGLYPGNWPKTMRVLKEHHVTDLFVNVAGAAFAHYPSDVLPRSKTFREEGDQLAACLAAAKGSGVRVHAWILCFNATRGSAGDLDAFDRRHWLTSTPDGKRTEYLDPSKPDVRHYVLRAIDEIQAKYRVDGIHLDFVRWYERAQRPRDAAASVSRFVADARRHVKRPLWLTAAVLGKYPSCVASVGQDWVGWLDANIVDYVVPMDYTEDLKKFEELIAGPGKKKAYARRMIAGIGVTANESRLNARQVIEQAAVARRHGLAGAALFDLDVTLERLILPCLAIGMW